MQKRLILMGAGAGVAIILAILGLNTARNAAGWQPITQTPAERLEMLAPSWRILQPATPGPHKAAILLSGCDGVHDNMDYWAQVMLKQDRAVMILNSHEPRRLDRAQAWRAVCAGQILPGAERAGDLAVALTAMHRMSGIEPDDTLILGASHGGWTAMEFMAGLTKNTPPPGLTAWPDKPASLAAQIGPVVLLYPYCGILSSGEERRWPEGTAGLMILAQKDSITDPEACRKMADKLAGKGVGINVTTLAGTDHGFDQRERSSLSPLEFNQPARDKATKLVTDFLKGFESAKPKI
ncbi:dienelactone hydrolase family protein [Paracoccus aestuariivivens]|uniref:Dienelactone hydrolase n=1 Tax=Paracoccus aestuariivivens TaxID=1820333 RepID=A0A6L6JAH9_9RHOB|nr:dienelactone hydrolase family protein [Paracoccus aestuariivivens]MTH77667.1 dienelactone hydrolase [Paracoccus aestuariivivens]